jgi:hypothetical protein
LDMGRSKETSFIWSKKQSFLSSSPWCNLLTNLHIYMHQKRSQGESSPHIEIDHGKNPKIDIKLLTNIFLYL